MANIHPFRSWAELQAVIFDVDGTLYDQAKLRRRMAAGFIKSYAFRPWLARELIVINHFRRERERHIFDDVADLERAQYRWAAEASGEPAEKVRRLVQKWMYDFPLRYLASCRHPGVADFFRMLGEKGIIRAIFSDYPARDKLAALGLSADYIFSAADKEINRLKPDPAGLRYIMKRLGVTAEHCLFIGDRDDRDGECARRAGMPFLLLDSRNPGKPCTFTGYAALLKTLDQGTTAGRLT